MANRGQLTPAIVAKAKELLDIELTVRHLRLIPYVINCLMNERRIDPRRINQEEREILSDWRARGWLVGGASEDSLAVTKAFWDIMCQLTWMGYVNYDDSAPVPLGFGSFAESVCADRPTA